MAVYTTQKSGPMASAQGALGVAPTEEQAKQNQAALQQQSEAALEQQRQFNEQAAGMGGYQNLTDVYSQQAALADQLRQMAMGQGPNPAAEQLRKTTQQNIETQKSLMASQRGAGANVGALQRRMGQQAAATSQAGTSQENVLRQQQQIAAMDALQQQQSMMGNMSAGQASAYQQALANLMGGTQGLQGLSQDQLQAMLSYQLGQRGQNMQQEINQKAIDLARRTGQVNLIGNLISGVASAGAGAIMGANMKGYAGAPETNISGGNTGFGFMQYQNPSPGSNIFGVQTNFGGASNLMPTSGQFGNLLPYGAEGGEVKKYAEGGPVSADSSNQSASLKEHYEDDDKIQHFADGGIMGPTINSANYGQIVDPQGSQSALVKALAAQQASQSAIEGQQGIVNKAASMQGIANMANVYGRQQALASQLGQLATGQGPNPALAQTQQAMGQGVESQAEAMAGQRGAGGSTGLMASQIGRRGSAAQQQLMGQGAGMAAEQQMKGVSALQRQQSEMGRLAGAQAGLESGGADILMKGTQGLQGLNQQQLKYMYENQLRQREQDITYGAKLQELKLKQEQAEQNFWTSIGKGILKGITAVASVVAAPATGGGSLAAGAGVIGALGAEGGEVKHFAKGGSVMPSSQKNVLKDHYSDEEPMSDVGRMLLKGTTAPRMASGGTAHDMRAGGHVPGKAIVGGATNSYANDIVPAMLSPGEIVLPRSVTQSANPADAAKQFVAAIKAKKGK